MTEPDVVLADILQKVLKLNANRVLVYDENYDAPKDSSLFIVISTGTSKIISSSHYFDETTQTEVREVALAQEYILDIQSRDRSAMSRKEEVVAALTSDYAEKQMEANTFRLFRNAQVLDLSEIAGGRAVHRYQTRCTMFYKQTFTESVEYFDNYLVTKEATSE